MLLPHQLSKVFSGQQGKNLIGQFIIARSDENIPSSWDRHKVEGFYIAHHPSLKLMKSDCANDNNTVIFIGYLINYQQKSLNLAPRYHTQGDIFITVESSLSDLSGRYICFVSNGSKSRVYLDASGSLSAVYSIESEIVASSIMLARLFMRNRNRAI